VLFNGTLNGPSKPLWLGGARFLGEASAGAQLHDLGPIQAVMHKPSVLPAIAVPPPLIHGELVRVSARCWPELDQA